MKSKLIEMLLCLCILLGVDCQSPPLPAEIKAAVERSADYLRHTVQNDGKFLYTVNLDPEMYIHDFYNYLRHAGAIYSMCQCYELNSQDSLKMAILQAGAFLKENGLRPLPDHDELLAVWSDQNITKSLLPSTFKLGGAGLALIALSSIEKIQPGFTAPENLQAIARFIQFMQKEDGSFYSKYTPSLGGMDTTWSSLYYPGEAALGLLMLNEIHPNDTWIETAAKALDYLATSRQQQDDVPADHWALLATQKLLTVIDDGEFVSRQILVSHAKQICRSMLASQIQSHPNSAFIGGFNIDGRITPTSTRLEGLLAALYILPPQHKLYRQIKKAAKQGVQLLLEQQIKNGKYKGGFTGAIAKKPAGSESVRAFNAQVTEIRIDYVQHAASALVNYYYFTK